MARKVLITFLGTNDYIPSNYYFGNKKIENTKFIQEAVIRIFCDEWNEGDKVFIFLTKDAERINWEDNEFKNQEGNKVLKEGLRKKLLLLKDEGFKVDIQAIKNIPDGLVEDDIWKIFDVVFNQLEKEDEVIFDITHGFRSIPMLAFALLNYAKFAKEIKIKGIYYGAFEVLGPAYNVKQMPQEQRNAPIVDLTSFSTLEDWTTGIHDFINLGTAKKMLELTNSQLIPVIKQKNEISELAKKIRIFAITLEEMTNIISTVRGQEIIKGDVFMKIKNDLKEIKKINFITPLQMILILIEKKVEKYDKNQILNGFIAVEFCIEHELIQQGITLLQEMILTFLITKYDEKQINNIDLRNAFSSALSIIENNIDETKWKGNKELLKTLIELSYIKQFSPIYSRIGRHRNSINHAGFTNNISAKDFKIVLKEEYEKVMKIISSFDDIDKVQ
ncbi:MAG: hypothetical protein OHK0038_24020 [Flammeovirgaceae bacterium]